MPGTAPPCGLRRHAPPASVAPCGSTPPCRRSTPPSPGALQRQPHRRAAHTWRNLKNVAVAVVVVGDHVHQVHALDARPGQVVPRAAGQPQPQRALDQAARQVAGAEAVRGELLASQVDQPHVAVQPPRLAQRQEQRRPEHHRRGRRVVIVGAGRGNASAVAAVLRIIQVRHVCSVVMVGHDDGPAADRARG